jgi:AcrR family transcriptional regulator
VSRGSFYWHFKDIADFRGQLLETWQEISTDRVIQDLDARPGEPDRLRHLLRSALTGTRTLDQAIRTWAAQDKAVATIVGAVDARRIARIAKLLVEAGVKSEPAMHRATVLYWAYLGQVLVMDPRHSTLPGAALDEISDLFMT